MPRIGLFLWALVLLGLWAPYSHAQQCTQTQLNTEFMTDPTVRGYTSCASDGNLAGVKVSDQCVLDKFNAACSDNACKVDQVVTREKVYEVIDSDEYVAMLKDTTKPERKAAMDEALYQTTFNMAVKEVRDKLLDIYPAPSSPNTNAAIKALQQKNVPRSQIVCTRLGTMSDVSCGLRGAACP